jgi:hypothetical protein
VAADVEQGDLPLRDADRQDDAVCLRDADRMPPFEVAMQRMQAQAWSVGIGTQIIEYPREAFASLWMLTLEASNRSGEVW